MIDSRRRSDESERPGGIESERRVDESSLTLPSGERKGQRWVDIFVVHQLFKQAKLRSSIIRGQETARTITTDIILFPQWHIMYPRRQKSGTLLI